MIRAAICSWRTPGRPDHPRTVHLPAQKIANFRVKDKTYQSLLCPVCGARITLEVQFAR